MLSVVLTGAFCNESSFTHVSFDQQRNQTRIIAGYSLKWGLAALPKSKRYQKAPVDFCRPMVCSEWILETWKLLMSDWSKEGQRVGLTAVGREEAKGIVKHLDTGITA